MNLRIIGVPSNVGALNKGTELGPSYFRNGGLIETLKKDHGVTDLGDLQIDNESYRHNHGPIRNWPVPLLMWDEVAKVDELFKASEFTIVIGGGCSILTGVFRNFHGVYGKQAELLSVDHHIDMKVPSPEQWVRRLILCISLHMKTSG
jgi:arginase family enzyme